jgi:hypothetical protein
MAQGRFELDSLTELSANPILKNSIVNPVLGQYLVYNGSEWVNSFNAFSTSFLNTPGSFTVNVPASVRFATFTVVGGGGGQGFTEEGGFAGGGGGGGGGVLQYKIPVVPNSNISCVVGQGGGYTQNGADSTVTIGSQILTGGGGSAGGSGNGSGGNGGSASISYATVSGGAGGINSSGAENGGNGIAGPFMMSGGGGGGYFINSSPVGGIGGNSGSYFGGGVIQFNPGGGASPLANGGTGNPSGSSIAKGTLGSGGGNTQGIGTGGNGYIEISFSAN